MKPGVSRSGKVTAAALCALALAVCARAGAPGAAKSGLTRVKVGEDLSADFDSKARLTLRRGKIVLVRNGGLLVAGKEKPADQGHMAVEKLPGEAKLPVWSLSGEEAPGNPSASLRVLKTGDALALAWDVNFRDRGGVSAWGFFLELPAAAHAGARVRLGGKQLILPRAPGKAELFRGPARSVRLFRGKKVYLRFLRDIPCQVILRDLRGAGGGKGFGLLFVGGPADLSGDARGRFCLALSGTGRAVKPLVHHVRMVPPGRPGGPVRVTIGLLADYRSPFDPGDVRVDLLVEPPKGAAYRQPAFYARDYASRIEKVDPAKGEKKTAPRPGAKPTEPYETEVFLPLGEPGWRALVDAHAVGLYRATVEVTTPAGTVRAEAKPLRLVRVAKRRSGPLAQSTKDSRYLVDPAGKPVFLLGHNLGWLVNQQGPLGTARWHEALDRMGKAGLNYARVWTCSWSLSIKTPRAYRFDLADAWKLDQVLEHAAGRGIHVQLCLDNFDDFRNKRHISPFFSGAKPVCKTTRDFFTLKAARRMHAARLRYMVARYGHHQNLMAWELWNELDYCIDKKARPEELARARKEYLVPWARSAARELAALDRRRRMVTCSLADGTVWPELAGAPEIGLIESHSYLYMPDLVRGKPALAARAVLAAASKQFAKYGKPGFVSEFGFGGMGKPESDINRTDKLGIHLHNGLWHSALSGHAGVVALWWWDSYLAPPGDEEQAKTEITGEDRYWHYRALGKYLKGVDWLAGWKKLTVSPPAAKGPHPLIVGMRTDQAVLVWVADQENTWYKRSVLKYKPVRITKAAFTVDGLVPGEYQVEWWDTYSGKRRTASRQATGERGSLRVRVPSFSRDVAARIKLLKRRKLAAEE